MGKDYVTPTVELDNHWNIFAGDRKDNITFTASALPPPEGPWWKMFNDDKLNALIDKSLTSNHELLMAQQRVLQAEAEQRQVNAGFLPQINANSSFKRETLGGSFRDKLDSTKNGGVSGNWDIDLFGSNIRRSEAAASATEAARDDVEKARLAVVSEVARNYIRLRGLQKQYELTQQNLGLQEDMLKMSEAQRKEKMVSELDVTRARAQANTTRARLPQITADIYAAINRLAVLSASSVGAVESQLSEAAPIPAVPVTWVGMSPADSVMQRPDIKAAERRLAQESALTAAAFAEFFPKVSLTGFFGRAVSDSFGSLTPWNYAANAAMPLLDFGRIQSQVDAANARQQQAYEQFQQQVLLAVEEVETSFSAYLNEVERMRALASASDDQSQSVTIVHEQYKAGIAPQIDVLVTERNALDAQNDLVLSEIEAANNLVQLYTALASGDGMASKPEENQVTLP